ncbi:MAG: hypothetical protein HRT68_02615 [Flavobacteriaceae bacterium]|nr:hypothetical protein [Flavobacteriaceae bacterium]
MIEITKTQLLVAIYIMLFLTVCVLLMRMSQDRDAIRKITRGQVKSFGSFYGGKFYGNPNLFLDDSDNEKVQKLIKSHNKKANIVYCVIGGALILTMFFGSLSTRDV